MSEQYPQDLLDLGYSQEIIDQYDNDLLRTLNGLMPWEVPGAEYQGWGNPYESWWGGGSIPMDDPRRAEAARALYEQTGTLYTPYFNTDPTLQKEIQQRVNTFNEWGKYRFGDEWETYYFDPTQFTDVSLERTDGRTGASYAAFRDALHNSLQDYYQGYDPESLNWRTDDYEIYRFNMGRKPYEEAVARREEILQRRAADQQLAESQGLSYKEWLTRRLAERDRKKQENNLRRQSTGMLEEKPKGLIESPYQKQYQETMFGQNQASQQLTQSSLLNNLSSTINSQRANILNNLFGKTGMSDQVRFNPGNPDDIIHM